MLSDACIYYTLTGTILRMYGMFFSSFFVFIGAKSKAKQRSAMSAQ